jgi:hypothetical protein
MELKSATQISVFNQRTQSETESTVYILPLGEAAL